MAILLVLLTFLLILAISHFRRRGKQPSAAAQLEIASLRPLPEPVPAIPQGYCFHPCHTWVGNEGGENARVGLDRFVGILFGEVDRVEVDGTEPMGAPGPEAADGSRCEHLR
jgi:hypothetical protein